MDSYHFKKFQVRSTRFHHIGINILVMNGVEVVSGGVVILNLLGDDLEDSLVRYAEDSVWFL